jgi:plasmid stabilization system protein ParE
VKQGRVRLRRDVPDDLHAIVAWLDQHSVHTSDRFIKAVFSALEDLARMPGKGSPKHFRSRRLTGIRSWAVPAFRKFLILYQPISDGIEVFAVVHGSRHLRSLLLKRV